MDAPQADESRYNERVTSEVKRMTERERRDVGRGMNANVCLFAPARIHLFMGVQILPSPGARSNEKTEPWTEWQVIFATSRKGCQGSSAIVVQSDLKYSCICDHRWWLKSLVTLQPRVYESLCSESVLIVERRRRSKAATPKKGEKTGRKATPDSPCWGP